MIMIDITIGNSYKVAIGNCYIVATIIIVNRSHHSNKRFDNDDL